jgi:hypothetical protein
VSGVHVSLHAWLRASEPLTGWHLLVSILPTPAHYAHAHHLVMQLAAVQAALGTAREDVTRGFNSLAHVYWVHTSVLTIDRHSTHHTCLPAHVACLHFSGLIETGIHLSDYYTFKICSPSRAAMHVGRYPWAAGFYDMVRCCTPVHMPIMSIHCRAHPHHINNYACSLTMHERDWCWTGDCVRKVDLCCACAWPA